MLHTLPKDILVKLVETVQKDYSTYLVARYEGYCEVSLYTFDDEQSVKTYLIDILRNEKTVESDSYKEISDTEYELIAEELQKYNLDQLVRQLSDFKIKFKIMKGKLLCE